LAHGQNWQNPGVLKRVLPLRNFFPKSAAILRVLIETGHQFQKSMKPTKEDLVLLAVDNHATRKLVSDHCARLDNVCLISGGIAGQ